MSIIFDKIPKACNEVIFVFGTVGLFLLFFDKRKLLFFCSAALILFMIGWRCFVSILSSRYASILIYPYTMLSAYAFISLIERRKICCNVLAYSFLLSIIIWFFHKSFYKPFCSPNQEIFAYIHEKENKKCDTKLIMHRDDYKRVLHFEKKKYASESYPIPVFIQDLLFYADNYSFVNKNVLYAIQFSSTDKSCLNHYSLGNIEVNKVFNAYSTRKKEKRISLYLIKSNAKFIVADELAPTKSGLLVNGDFEQVDSLEESRNNVQKHIYNFFYFYNRDLRIYTPHNVIFFNDSKYTYSLPVYNCSNSSPLFGQYSVYISSKAYPASIIFDQRFNNGSYFISFFIKGKKGTIVTLFINSYINSKWKPKSLITFELPSDDLYYLSTLFNVDFLHEQDLFKIGSSIFNGEAFLDNFFLDKGTFF